MPPQDDTGSLESARERLYSPRALHSRLRRALSESRAAELPHAWAARLAPKAHPHVRLALLFFVLAVGFFIVAAGLAALLLFTGSTSVSTDNITLTVQGPTTIAGGDTVPLSLAITNKNIVPLQNATLEVDFPPGTRSASDKSQNYPRYTENLGTLAPGVTVFRSVKAVVFASAGSALSIPLSLSYTAQGSNSTFVKKTSYPLSVTSAPLSISVEAPAEAVSGKPVALTITVRSNATIPINNVILAAQLPFGFSLISSSPAMRGGSFVLGTLAPGSAETLTLQGTLAGQAGDLRNFRFAIGTGNVPTDTVPAITYMTQTAEVAIAAPFLATSLIINGDSSDSPVLAPGANNTVTLSWQNALSVPLENATISVALTGAVVPGSIQSASGFYDSTTGTITFNQSTDPSLATLAPGATGVGSFSFETAPAGSGRPQVTFSVSIAGERAGESGVPEQVSASLVKTANLRSSLSLSASALHASGSIANSGPIPPVVGQTTTYAVYWQLTDPGSDVTNTQVTATLPSYVTYTGQTTGTSITYDPGTRTVSWKPGDLTQGQSTSVAFQVSITPSSSQRGTAPPLTSGASFTGFDRFAQVQVQASANAVSTQTADGGVSGSTVQ